MTIQKRIAVISLGFIPLNAERLCKWLNKKQSYFKFENVTEIINLGEPDLIGYAYSDSNLEKLVNSHIKEHDYVVLFTSVPIEDNYFTRTINSRIIILTYHQTEELLVSSKRTPEEYASLGIAQELISLEFQRVTKKDWRNLFHQDPRGCLFDFAGHKSQKIYKLKKGRICNPCIGKLEDANLDRRVVSAGIKIINSVIKPSLTKAVYSCVQQPGLSFIYGGVILATAVNLISYFILGDINTTEEVVLSVVIASGVVLFPIGKLVWDWSHYFRTNRR